MASIQLLAYDSLTNLNSTEGELTVIVKNLANQESLIRDQISLQQKTIHQLRIANIYNSNVNDLVIDDNIFENDETD